MWEGARKPYNKQNIHRIPITVIKTVWCSYTYVASVTNTKGSVRGSSGGGRGPSGGGPLPRPDPNTDVFLFYFDLDDRIE